MAHCFRDIEQSSCLTGGWVADQKLLYIITDNTGLAIAKCTDSLDCNLTIRSESSWSVLCLDLWKCNQFWVMMIDKLVKITCTDAYDWIFLAEATNITKRTISLVDYWVVRASVSCKVLLSCLVVFLVSTSDSYAKLPIAAHSSIGKMWVRFFPPFGINGWSSSIRSENTCLFVSEMIEWRASSSPVSWAFKCRIREWTEFPQLRPIQIYNGQENQTNSICRCKHWFHGCLDEYKRDRSYVTTAVEKWMSGRD